MDYLAILKSLDTGNAETSNVRAAVAEPSYEINELNEKKYVQQAQLTDHSPQCPGPEFCAGCYSVGVIDDREQFIHPPRASPEWESWLRRSQPKGTVQ